MTLTTLKKLCRHWQETLRVTDWTISVRWAKSGELAEAYGTNAYDPRQMLAEIVIRPEVDVSQFLIYPDGGIEQTLIHEILHIVMHGEVDYEKENIMQERAINQIADALYWTYHRNPRKPRSKKK